MIITSPTVSFLSVFLVIMASSVALFFCISFTHYRTNMSVFSVVTTGTTYFHISTFQVQSLLS